MFARRSTSFRVTALVGVALAMLTCLQQVHGVCASHGCSLTKAAACHDGCCAGHDVCGSCTLPAPGCDRQPPSHTDGPSFGPEVPPTEVPCGDNCWCCKPAPPQQLTSPVDADELTHVVGWGWEIVTTSVSDLPPAGGLPSTSELLPPHALDKCVRLCRFLI